MHGSLLRAAAAALAFTVVPTGAHAANWVAIHGADPATTPAVRPYGFVQGGYEQTFGAPVRGLTKLGDFNGRQAAANVVGSGDTTGAFYLRRARFGLRGAALGGERPVSFAVQAEFADNALTRMDPVVLTDAYLAARLAPGLRVKAGQFKLPVVEEGYESNPLVADFVYASNTALLAYENPVGYVPSTGVAAYSGGGTGFRDIGVQVYDWLRVARWEWSYAAVLSNGRFGAPDVDDAKDVTARLQSAYVWSGDVFDLERKSVQAFVWDTRGRRDYKGRMNHRFRRGAGVEAAYAPVRIRAEYVYAQGMLETGVQPAFFGGAPTVLQGGHARAFAVQGSYRFLPQWEANARFDQLDRAWDVPEARRIFRTTTLGAQFVAHPRLRVLVNYEFRTIDAQDAAGDAKLIAEALADRAAVQAVVVF